MHASGSKQLSQHHHTMYSSSATGHVSELEIAYLYERYTAVFLIKTTRDGHGWLGRVKQEGGSEESRQSRGATALTSE